MKFKKDKSPETKADPPKEKKEPLKTEKETSREEKPKAGQTVIELKKTPEKKKQDSVIVFKVQFASSEVPLNLQQEKYSPVIDGDFYKMKGILKYTSGNFLLIQDAIRHQNMLREKGFKDCFVIAFKNGERIDVKEARAQLGQ